jgi:hypothetical protein
VARQAERGLIGRVGIGIWVVRVVRVCDPARRAHHMRVVAALALDRVAARSDHRVLRRELELLVDLFGARSGHVGLVIPIAISDRLVRADEPIRGLGVAAVAVILLQLVGDRTTQRR